MLPPLLCRYIAFGTIALSIALANVEEDASVLTLYPDVYEEKIGVITEKRRKRDLGMFPDVRGEFQGIKDERRGEDSAQAILR